MSRAVANLASLSEYCIPFVKKGGFFIPYKSGEIEEELNQGKKAAAILGGEINEVVRFSLPEGDGARSLIRIRKVKPVSSRYPRKGGPGKEPLGKIGAKAEYMWVRSVPQERWKRFTIPYDA